jgi:tetratricopeptide (TPR) repeat protein
MRPQCQPRAGTGLAAAPRRAAPPAPPPAPPPPPRLAADAAACLLSLAPFPAPPPPPAATLPRLAAAAAAACLLALAPGGPALAENVRVEDVASPTLRAGLEAANRGDLSAAERFFQIYIEKEDPASASARSNLGNVHLQQGRLAAAVADFDAAVERAPEAPVIRLNRCVAREALGVEAAAAGDVAGAERLWRAALTDADAAVAADPREFAAWYDRGLVQMRLASTDEDWAAARASFDRAADLAPGLAGYRLRSAALAFQCGDAERARLALRGVARKSPAYAEARAALAAVEWARGEGGAAEEQLAAATALDPAWGAAAGLDARARWPPALVEAYMKCLNVS